MLQAVPVLVFPGPFSPFESEYDGHEKSEKWHKRPNADPCPVSNGPDPIPEKCTPRPTLDPFGDHVCRGGVGGATVGASWCGLMDFFTAGSAKYQAHDDSLSVN